MCVGLRDEAFQKVIILFAKYVDLLNLFVDCLLNLRAFINLTIRQNIAPPYLLNPSKVCYGNIP